MGSKMAGLMQGCTLGSFNPPKLSPGDVRGVPKLNFKAKIANFWRVVLLLVMISGGLEDSTDCPQMWHAMFNPFAAFFN